MRTAPGAAVAVALALVLGPACGSSPTTPTPPPAACTFQITTSGNSFGAGGGSTTVTISTAAGCSWSASVNEVWVTLGTTASGTGPGSVIVSVAPNTTTSARQCAVTVAGQAIALTQEAQPVGCAFALTPAYERFGASGGRRTFAVATAAACAWTAVSDAPWLTVTSGGSASGSGDVGYEVAAWGGSEERSAAIAVGPARFTVRQDPPAPAACDYTIGPVVFTPCMPASTMTATIAAQSGCSWTVTPDVSWIEVTSGEAGTGPGVITLRVSDNYDAPRQGLVKVRWPTPTAGQNLQVQQAGCVYAVSTASIDIGAVGGTGLTFSVIQQSLPNTCGGPLQDACVWTATSDVSWITITTAMPQVGDGPVRFNVADNPATTPRSGNVTVRDKTVRINQAGK